MKRALAALAFGLLGACKGKPAPPAPSMPSSVEVSGCAAFAVAPPRCELASDRVVRLVVPPGFSPSIAGEPTAVTNGTRFRVVVPQGVNEIRVGAWVLAVVEPPKIAAIDEAKALREKGKNDEAAALLDTFLATAQGEARARALSLRARVAIARGEVELSVASFREAIALNHTFHRRSEEADDAFALSYVLNDRLQQYAEARAVLAGLGSLDDYPDGAARRPYYTAATLFLTGDLRSVTEELRRARNMSERLGFDRLSFVVEQMLSITLSRSGKGTDALALLRARDARTLSPCEAAQLAVNTGWVSLLLRDAEVAQHDPVPPLETALKLYSGPCPDVNAKASTLVNLALAAVQRGTFDVAAARLADARGALQQSAPGSQITLWMTELDARIALGRGDTKLALASFDRQRVLARSTFAPDVEWRATVGIGETLESRHDDAGALAAYLEAERILDRASVDMVLLDARDAFLGDREKSARLLVDLLVRLHRNDEAMAAARGARSRSIAALFREGRVASLPTEPRKKWDSLLAKYRTDRAALDREAEGDWKLADDKLAAVRASRKEREASLRASIEEAYGLVGGGSATLPPIAGGDLLLLRFPTRTGNVGFAADATGVVASRAEGLEPFHEKIASAKCVRVLPYGANHAVDVHALPFDGAPLIEHAPVVYALDLAGAPKSSGDAALLVADPSGDLPAARVEADVVAKALGNPKSLRGASATKQAVLDALPHASLFHYAGHASYVGDDPWESVLPLANGRLSIVDVLALVSAPRVVSLFACESGRTVTRGEGLGLAQAFLAAGAEIVVASTRDVADTLAADLARELYGNAGTALSTNVPTSVPQALRSAQIALRKRAPNSDWSAFRAFVP